MRNALRKPLPGKLRVVFVIDDSLDQPDGVQQATLSLGRYLNRQGHLVKYITSTIGPDVDTDIHAFARVLRLNFNGNRLGTPYRTDVRRLKAFLKDHTFDIAHVQTPYSPLLAGRVICNLPTRTKVLASLHVMPRGRLAEAGIKSLKRLAFKSFKRIDGFAANAPEVAEYYQRVWQLPEMPIVAVPVDLTGFPATIRPYRKAGKLNLVFLGRLVERKGCLDLIEALKLLSAALQKKLHLHIGGRGELASRAKRLVAVSGLADSVTFHGFIQERDKAAFLASGDLLVFPSRGGESFGISLIEALAAGRGLVLAAHNIGYDSILNGQSELMFEPENPTSLAACLQRWLTSSTAGRTDILRWQKSRLKEYDLETVVGPQTLALYRQLL